MGHGALICEVKLDGMWLWDFATRRNDGIALAARADSADWSPSQHRADFWKESLLRSIGPVPTHPNHSEEYARFEPTWDRPFRHIFGHALGRRYAVFGPLSTADDQFCRVLADLHEQSGDLVRLCVDNRKLRPALLYVHVPRWFCAVGFTYELPGCLFLADKAATLDELVAALPDPTSEVRERW